MQSRTRSIPLWFIAVFVPNLTSQLVRLHQTSPINWLICDYAGRLSVLLLLAAIPAARSVAFRRQRLMTSWWETLLWIAGLVLIMTTVEPWLVNYGDRCLPNIRLGHYPQPHGWLRVFDLTAGLALVAYHEEVVFRRCAGEVFSSGWENTSMIVITSLLFSANHWWTGIANMMGMFFFGVYTMLFLKRTRALWPVFLAHYLVDLICFY